jgi:hypothetical protein
MSKRFTDSRPFSRTGEDEHRHALIERMRTLTVAVREHCEIGSTSDSFPAEW